MVEFIDIPYTPPPDVPTPLDYPPYVDRRTIKKLEDLPVKAAIYILRQVNLNRLRGHVDEFANLVLRTLADPCALGLSNFDVYHMFDSFVKSVEELRFASTESKIELRRYAENFKRDLLGGREEEPERLPIELPDIYTLFLGSLDYLFVMYDEANYFQDESEVKETERTVFEMYNPEISPENIIKLDDLTKYDAIRLIRIVNSFHRKDIVDKFLSDIGDFEGIYDLLSLWVVYIFQEYKNANYFLNEPELYDPEFQEKEFGTAIRIEGEFD